MTLQCFLHQIRFRHYWIQLTKTKIRDDQQQKAHEKQRADGRYEELLRRMCCLGDPFQIVRWHARQLLGIGHQDQHQWHTERDERVAQKSKQDQTRRTQFTTRNYVPFFSVVCLLIRMRSSTKKKHMLLTCNLPNMRANVQTHYGQPEKASQYKILYDIANALRYNSTNLGNAQQEKANGQTQ